MSASRKQETPAVVEMLIEDGAVKTQGPSHIEMRRITAKARPGG